MSRLDVTKQAVVVHSGGMDSSICLALAAERWGPSQVLSLSMEYGQRHHSELSQAAKICRDWEIDHHQISIPLAQLTRDALTCRQIAISEEGDVPTTLVVGRNGLFARLAAIHAHQLGARSIYMGVTLEHSGYRDCSREYMDLKQQILRQDLNDPIFTIETPLVAMTKQQTLEEAHRLGLLAYLLENTITCYQGLPRIGCNSCPSCELRNEGLRLFAKQYPEVILPYSV